VLLRNSFGRNLVNISFVGNEFGGKGKGTFLMETSIGGKEEPVDISYLSK